MTAFLEDSLSEDNLLIMEQFTIDNNAAITAEN